MPKKKKPEPVQGQIKKGELLTICTGCYSDYCVRMVVKALKTVDAKEVLESYPKKEEYVEWAGVLAWLLKNKYVEEVDYREWHIGEYGRLESSI